MRFIPTLTDARRAPDSHNQRHVLRSRAALELTMDDRTAFLELSALLTGLRDDLLDDPVERALNEPIAVEYARRLRGTRRRLVDDGLA